MFAAVCGNKFVFVAVGGVGKVYAGIDHFWECGTCNHIYWEGPKFFEAREMFESLCNDVNDTNNNDNRNGDSAAVSSTSIPTMFPQAEIMSAVIEVRKARQQRHKQQKECP